MKNKNLIIGVALIAIAAVGFFLWSQNSVKKYAPKDDAGALEHAFMTFERYMTAAKDHDLKTLTRYSYQLSEQCADSDRKEECFVLMDNVYSLFSDLKKGDFETVWWDNKQLILLSATTTIENETSRWYSTTVLFFAVKDGELRVLNGNPARVWFVDKQKEGEDAHVIVAMKDDDKDGLENGKENCDRVVGDCVKTDPDNRDSDGDGWWDGIQVFFKAAPAKTDSNPQG